MIEKYTGEEFKELKSAQQTVNMYLYYKVEFTLVNYGTKIMWEGHALAEGHAYELAIKAFLQNTSSDYGVKYGNVYPHEIKKLKIVEVPKPSYKMMEEDRSWHRFVGMWIGALATVGIAVLSQLVM